MCNKLILLEAIFVGLSNILISYPVTILLKTIQNKKINAACVDWNKYYIMEISLFLIGFILHLTYELIGINKYYANYKHNN